MVLQRGQNPGIFQGDLGFELVEVFRFRSAIGPLTLNDQFAEEAFTVYDHPKVFMFQKDQRLRSPGSTSAMLGIGGLLAG